MAPDYDSELEADARRDEELARLLTPGEYACYQVGRSDLVVCYLQRVAPGSKTLATVERALAKWRRRRDQLNLKGG